MKMVLALELHIDMITVVIPFYDQSIYRRRNLSAVIDNFYNNYPMCKIIVAEQLSSSTYIRDILIPNYPLLTHVQVKVDSDRFNKSYVLNKTIREYVKTDIIIMSDADCILPKLNVDTFKNELIKHSVYFPFSRVNFLNEAHSRRYVKGLSLIQVNSKQDLFINRYTGLINIFTRNTFDSVAGFDEEFEGWGGEDDAFIDKCNRIISPIKRCTDDVELIHLYHPTVNTLEYMSTECFTWNKKRIATIRRMSDDELRLYISNVLKDVKNPLEPIVKDYDAKGKLDFSVNLNLGNGSIDIDTIVYPLTIIDGKVELDNILQVILDIDGIDFLNYIINLIDTKLNNLSDADSIVIDRFRNIR